MSVITRSTRAREVKERVARWIVPRRPGIYGKIEVRVPREQGSGPSDAEQRRTEHFECAFHCIGGVLPSSSFMGLGSWN